MRREWIAIAPGGTIWRLGDALAFVWRRSHVEGGPWSAARPTGYPQHGFETPTDAARYAAAEPEPSR